MRNLALAVIAIFCFLSLGCDVVLQPSQQGEWSDFHNTKAQVSKDAKPPAEKPSAEK